MPQRSWNAREFFKNNALTLILAVLIVIVAIWLIKDPALKFQTDIIKRIDDLLVGLLALTLFVERALSVITDSGLGEEREKRERAAAIVAGQVATSKREVESAMEAPSRLTREGAPTSDTATALAQVGPTVDKLNKRLDELKSEETRAVTAATEIEARQDRVRLVFGFLFALLISAVGVRVLSEFFTTLPAEGSWRRTLFDGLDIVITAGVIAGSSTFFNSIADVLGKYADALRQRATPR
jgi:hypothetical protein